jgi:hypothetical protein
MIMSWELKCYHGGCDRQAWKHIDVLDAPDSFQNQPQLVSPAPDMQPSHTPVSQVLPMNTYSVFAPDKAYRKRNPTVR